MIQQRKSPSNLGESSNETAGSQDASDNGNAGDLQARALAQDSSITIVNLKSARIGPEGAKALAGSVSITNLNLDCNNIGDEGAQALSKSSVLIGLSLHTNGIGNDGAVALAASNTITSLDLSFNVVQTKGARTLAANTTLTSLSLQSNRIGIEATRAFAANRNVTELNLSLNKLEDEGARFLSSNQCITHLIMMQNHLGPAGARALTNITTLRYLNISNNRVGDKGAQIFANNPTLTSLNLSRNFVGEEGACALACSTTLTSLNLQGNKISDQGAMALTRSVSLVSLDIQDNKLTDDGLRAFTNRWGTSRIRTREVQPADLEKEILNVASVCDTAEGHGELKSDDRDRHEVRNKSTAEIAFIKSKFSSDSTNLHYFLNEWLKVVIAENEASAAGQKEKGFLFNIYESTKEAYYSAIQTEVCIAETVGEIQKYAAACDTAEGHDALAEDDEDRHEVLQKSNAEIFSLKERFPNDKTSLLIFLTQWLGVVKADNAASSAKQKKKGPLHDKYESSKKEYFEALSQAQVLPKPSKRVSVTANPKSKRGSVIDVSNTDLKIPNSPKVSSDEKKIQFMDDLKMPNSPKVSRDEKKIQFMDDLKKPNSPKVSREEKKLQFMDDVKMPNSPKVSREEKKLQFTDAVKVPNSPKVSRDEKKLQFTDEVKMSNSPKVSRDEKSLQFMDDLKISNSPKVSRDETSAQFMDDVKLSEFPEHTFDEKSQQYSDMDDTINAFVESQILKNAALFDTAEGHDELKEEDSDRHEVLNKSVEEIARIKKAFAHDKAKTTHFLKEWLKVVKADNAASTSGQSHGGPLHNKYEAIKDAYFAAFPNRNGSISTEKEPSIPDLVSEIIKNAAACDAAAGHGLLRDDDDDQHEVLRKSIQEVARIKSCFSKDQPNLQRFLKDWLAVVIADKEASIAGQSEKGPLHDHYESTKGKYFAAFPNLAPSNDLPQIPQKSSNVSVPVPTRKSAAWGPKAYGPILTPIASRRTVMDFSEEPRDNMNNTGYGSFQNSSRMPSQEQEYITAAIYQNMHTSSLMMPYQEQTEQDIADIRSLQNSGPKSRESDPFDQAGCPIA